METIAFLGLLGLGYLAAPKSKSEGFQDAATVSDNDVGDRIDVSQPAIASQDTGRTLTGQLDVQFRLPTVTGPAYPREPQPAALQGGAFQYGTGIKPMPSDATAPENVRRVQMRPDAVEDATGGREGFVSALSGVAFSAGEFKHNNMVPFFRGQVKQNLADGANRQILDTQTGSGSVQYAKREQTPFFEPTKQPMGNPFGLEATTDFVESRMNAPRNRAGERPVEPIHVGPGLNEGFTHIPSGGFQQQAGEEFVIARLPRTNDLRVATNPKLSYAKPVVPGAHFITTSGTAETVGEVRKYAPDRFYLNKKGERNFVTTGEDRKATVRSTQVLKDTTRMETTTEYAGPAGQAEGAATYTVAAAKAPLVKQHGPFGYRNADATNYFNADTDADQNDYGKSGVEIRRNERFYTGERVHATNLAADDYQGTVHFQDAARPTRAEEVEENFRVAGNFNAIGGGLPEKATTYDPKDVARTTIKETTIDNDWLGLAAPVSEQPRLTVYDPNDVARTTIKETTVDNNWIGIAAPDQAQKLTVYDPDDIARITGRNTLDELNWKGPAGADVSNLMNQTAARNVRHYAQKEVVASGRTPTNSSTKVFNGEDYVNLTYRKLVADSVNDRQPTLDRVTAETTSVEAIGIQRPRAALKLDVSAERNQPVVVCALEENPYVIPLHTVAKLGGAKRIV